MTDQQRAFAIVINSLFALGETLNVNLKFSQDLRYAAELMGMELTDLGMVLRGEE